MTFIPIDDFDAFFEKLHADEKMAMANLMPIQREITYGSYWIRPMPELECFIFGRVYTEEEVARGEEPETIENMRESHGRGYRFGMCHSVIEPRGELGDTHVSHCFPITKEEFDQAQEQDWTLTREQFMTIRARITEGMDE
jgi:hypothetical protein